MLLVLLLGGGSSQALGTWRGFFYGSCVWSLLCLLVIEKGKVKKKGGGGGAWVLFPGLYSHSVEYCNCVIHIWLPP